MFVILQKIITHTVLKIQFKLEDIQSYETFQPIGHEGKFLMDYNYCYFVALG